MVSATTVFPSFGTMEALLFANHAAEQREWHSRAGGTSLTECLEQALEALWPDVVRDLPKELTPDRCAGVSGFAGSCTEGR